MYQLQQQQQQQQQLQPACLALQEQIKGSLLCKMMEPFLHHLPIKILKAPIVLHIVF